MAINKKNSLLWQIQHPAEGGFSYLFGTMHVRDKKAFEFISMAEKHILECEAFATEFNLAEAENLSSSEHLTLPDGLSLSSLLRPKQFKKLDKYFLRITGIPLRIFDQSYPLMITNLMAGRMLSADMAVSLDEQLWNFAKANEKIMLGIESFEEQLRIMKKIPIDLQLSSLLAAVKNIKKFRRETLKITAVYQSGDIVKMYRKTKKSIGGLRKILLYKRNRIMAERIAAMSAEQSIFVAIGAGHLAGEKGVLKLLKEEGMIVKAINTN